MKSKKYLLYHEIIDLIREEYQNNHCMLAFSQAVQTLISTKKYHVGIPTYPDFSLWDTNNISSLKDFTDQIPVFLDEINQPTYSNFYNEASYISNTPVFISPSAFYSPDFYKRFDDYIILFYVLAGQVFLDLKSEICNLHKRNLLIVTAGKPWHLACSDEDIVLQIMIREDYFKDYFLSKTKNQILIKQFYYQTLFTNQKDYISFILEPSPQILDIIKNLFSEYLLKDAYSSEIFMNYLQIFFTYILRSAGHVHFTNKTDTNLAVKTMFPSILQYIYDHYEDLTLDELANHFHYTTVYLSKLITDNMGESFKAIVTRLKIKKAKELLTTTNLSITQIGSISGYNKPDYFAVAFKKETGITPSDYRKNFTKHN